jgi:hypothetical protein
MATMAGRVPIATPSLFVGRIHELLELVRPTVNGNWTGKYGVVKPERF